MTRAKLSKDALLPLMAAYVLEHGLADLSLRPLARAAGTSDRMLIYHFGSKDALIAELLGHLSDMFTAALDGAFPQGRARSRRACVEQVLTITGQPAFAPFFVVWWDIVAGSARGEAAYREAAGQIMDRLLAWAEAHLPQDDPDPAAGARLVLTLIEGAQMLDAVGRSAIGKDGLSALEN